MEFEYAFKGNSSVTNRADSTALSFSPDTKREPTYFSGELRKGIAFREAISALHDVVVSDMRFKPKDKSGYKEWAAKQEAIDWDQVAAQRSISFIRSATSARMCGCVGMTQSPRRRPSSAVAAT